MQTSPRRARICAISIQHCFRPDYRMSKGRAGTPRVDYQSKDNLGYPGRKRSLIRQQLLCNPYIWFLLETCPAAIEICMSLRGKMGATGAWSVPSRAGNGFKGQKREAAYSPEQETQPPGVVLTSETPLDQRTLTPAPRAPAVSHEQQQKVKISINRLPSRASGRDGRRTAHTPLSTRQLTAHCAGPPDP